MNVDVEIYLSNVIKFFNNNQNELRSLVPLEKKEEFFKKIREIAIFNAEKGEEITLTQDQLMRICVELNTKIPITSVDSKKIIQKTIFGEYSLN